MKLILTNDDGIEAPGIRALYEAAKQVGEATVYAPLLPMSGVSHRVTTSERFRVEAREPDWHAVHGTPGDCARVAVFHHQGEPMCVLSGINNGGNLGVDLWHSGTVAAVREAVIYGVPGIALSQYKRRGVEIDWERSTRWVVPILKDLLAEEIEPGTFWNINLPCLESDDPEPEVVYCDVDPSPLPLDYLREGDEIHYSGVYYEREKQPGKDVDLCFGGSITVSKISLVH